MEKNCIILIYKYIMTFGNSVKIVYASKYLIYMPLKEKLIKIIRDEKELYELAQENENE